LNFSELFKHVLIVQNSMGKLIFKSCTFQKLGYSWLNLRHLEKLVDCRSFGRVCL
jgi:hypothetical protein